MLREIQDYSEQSFSDISICHHNLNGAKMLYMSNNLFIYLSFTNK